ncbi:hypothetical protein HYW76_01200 [Candidatus Pacearchaeota archaeon]|nr:hypothetical protein [Candidatus Pacearchaeota archaeon]
MESKILKKLGLNDNEINIYLTLLKKGVLSAGEIAKISKLHRTHVYDLLESLAKKGVVSFSSKSDKKYFEAVAPEKLEVLLKKKEEELEEEKKELNNLISELKNITSEEKTKLLASIYLGKQGFMSQLNDILRTLNKGEEYLVMGLTQKADETLKYFLPGFGRRRVEKGIKRKIILDFDLKGKEQTQQKLQQVRYLPKEYKIPMGIIIYDDRIIIVIIEEDYICLRIENKKISNNFRRYFELIWKRSRN